VVSVVYLDLEDRQRLESISSISQSTSSGVATSPRMKEWFRTPEGGHVGLIRRGLGGLLNRGSDLSLL